MTSFFDGAGILVTGGTGSFGQAFVRHILSVAKPSRLVVLSRDEQKHHRMQQMFPIREHPNLRFFIGDVRDESRLKRAMSGIDIVVHAAAIKHVPIAEYNPIEAIRTNVMGAENVINAAIDGGVGRIIALSTDKAANPINLYGASKLCSDKLFVAANNLSGQDGSRFSVVRYGNVLGSNGSVVPYFLDLIAAGATSLPITDQRMTRFWITLERGVSFVCRCLEGMSGGETFVPKIPSMKVVDLAKAMAPDLPHENVGIRPGEKLHELMITADDANNTLEFDDCYLIRPTGVLKLMHAEFTMDGKLGKPVAADFEYRSDLNAEWLSNEQMAALLADDAIDPARRGSTD
jgi:UDP-N-acetylglucosamine 4,6-dehydratase/5-epimerase